MSEIILNWPGKGKETFPGYPVLKPEIKGKITSNLLFQGDNLSILHWLVKRGVQVDLIYMDPPFFTGNKFSSKIRLEKENFEISDIGFQDNWSQGLETYLEMLYQRLVPAVKLLKKTGSLFVHLDWRAVHYVKIILDELLGRENFRNEIIWWYHDPSGRTQKTYMRKHDTILFYSRTDEYKFNLEEVRVPYAQSTLKQAEKGTISFGRETRVNPRGRPPEDVWEIPIINSQAKERLGYPTQKPLDLLKRIIKGSSDPGDIVLDPFCGSGTTIQAAEELNRKWIGIDENNFGLYLAKRRLENTGGSKFVFSRDKKFIEKKGEKTKKAFYRKLSIENIKVVFAPEEKNVRRQLEEYQKSQKIHLWFNDFNQETLQELEENYPNLLFFPLYDQTGFPLGKLEMDWIPKEKGGTLVLDKYLQPFLEKSQFSKLKTEKLIESIFLITGEKKKRIIPWEWPQKVEIPPVNKQRCSIKIRDILGREREYVILKTKSK